MKKIIIDETLKGRELFDFLIANKSDLIAQKKAIIKTTDAISSNTFFTSKATKAAEDTGSIHVKVVANAALWMDSQMDVLLPDCWKRSINNRKGMIPHLHDHVHTVDAVVGDVTDIYAQDISLRELGLDKSGSTQCLIFETDIVKSYNEKVYNLYRQGKIKQHSIGLNYVKIEIAINDEESQKEFDFWNKYIDKVINREEAEGRGFFFVVSEIKLLENSAVLFGSNELTPTLDAKHPTPGTDENHSSTVTDFDLDKAIKTTKFFN